MKVLVTGATGYIGGRLVPRLLEKGISVRVLVRDPGRVAGRRWRDQVEVIRGDLLDPPTLGDAFDGIDVAYYLVHSMYTGRGFVKRDRRAVENFCKAGAALPHVIYLGGLLPKSREIRSGRSSRHLQSRADIGNILGDYLPTTEFRAGPIIGSGSASFEMLRYLTERLPVMLAPSWVCNEVQSIAVRDVLSYLLLALERGPSGIVDVGSDRMSYKEMMLTYARVRELRRVVIPVPPLLPARFGAEAIGLLTPIPGTLAIALVESMAEPLIAHTHRARALFPDVQPIRYEQALRLALQRIDHHAVETRWSDAASESSPYEYTDSEGLVREVRTLHVEASPEEVFRVFSGLGGDRGWLMWDWAWTLRGILDSMVGGIGLRRGRRHPDELLAGEAVDFWRVEAVSYPHLLRLRSEIKLPGRGWLQWEATPSENGTRLVQTAAFAPRGLAGALYWTALYPFHRRIFTGMIRAIGRNAVGGAAAAPQGVEETL